MPLLQFIHHVYLFRNNIFHKLILFPALNKKRLFNVDGLLGGACVNHSPVDDGGGVGDEGSRVLCNVGNQLRNYRVS